MKHKNQIQTIKTNSSSLSLFHLNTCSFNRNFDDLEYLLKTTNQTFDIIAISESRILKNQKINIHLPNYVTGSTLLYIHDQLAYKPRIGMNIQVL